MLDLLITHNNLSLIASFYGEITANLNLLAIIRNQLHTIFHIEKSR